MNMTRNFAVVACGLSLSACTSWMPSLDLFTPAPATATLTIESDPPGAEARTSLGNTCRTPCTMSVTAANEFTVSYSLNGYTSQSLPVKPGSATGSGALLDPNPVFAQLIAVPPAKPAPPKRKKRPAITPAAQAPPPTQGAFDPPPGAFTPVR